MKKYSEQLSKLRDEVIDEFHRQFPTKHDSLSFVPNDVSEEDDDTEWRQELPYINIRHKHFSYSSEQVTGIKWVEKELSVTSEDTETNDDNTYPLDWLETSELCMILDLVIENVIENKKYTNP